jgi:hypothetical protein
MRLANDPTGHGISAAWPKRSFHAAFAPADVGPPVALVCSPTRASFLIRRDLQPGAGHPDSSFSSRARRAAALRSEMPSLR